MISFLTEHPSKGFFWKASQTKSAIITSWTSPFLTPFHSCVCEKFKLYYHIYYLFLLWISNTGLSAYRFEFKMSEDCKLTFWWCAFYTRWVYLRMCWVRNLLAVLNCLTFEEVAALCLVLSEKQYVKGRISISPWTDFPPKRPTITNARYLITADIEANYSNIGCLCDSNARSKFHINFMSHQNSATPTSFNTYKKGCTVSFCYPPNIETSM